MCTTSGLASPRSSVKSPKYCLTGNLSYNCLAISGSLSHTPTISHPLILWICEAWESAILPHPTMATLSIVSAGPAGLEITAEPFAGWHFGCPADPGLQLVIAVIGLLPVGMPHFAIEYGF